MTASKQLHTKQIAQNKFLCKHQVLNRTVTHQFLIKSLFLPDFPQKIRLLAFRTPNKKLQLLHQQP